MALLAKKLGMSRLFDQETGRHIPITLLSADDCVVVGHKTQEKDGYQAVQIGAGAIPPKRLSKPLRGMFAGRGVSAACRKIVEVPVVEGRDSAVGSKVDVGIFPEGSFVDVSATSRGKGFQGGMKRHNFGGLRASHGVSISHRSHGSTGQCTFPGRVFKGKKMAGHMGAERVTVQSMRVAFLDAEKGLLGICGGVPGGVGGFVVVKPAVKHAGKKVGK